MCSTRIPRTSKASAITALLEGGVPMDMVRQRAGHSTIGMTAHYYHASDKTLQAAADALPAIGKAANHTSGAPHAAETAFEGILAKRDSLTAQQLDQVVTKAREIADSRK